MNKRVLLYKKKVRNAAKRIAFSDASRRIAREIYSLSRKSSVVSAGIERTNSSEIFSRLSSEGLPEGKYFAKLTIKDWESHLDKKFKLFQGNKLIYGNKIERPARGFPLEYRNIVVSSRNLKNFSLSIDASFTLAISQGAFSTQQQTDYDIQYGVEQHGDVFYSLRGNKVNPKKIIITFPGFGPSTTRIPYSVSYLKGLTDEDLKDTIMVCFQDRYMVSGTYMITDSAGRPLYSRVKATIDSLLREYKLQDSDMLLFGASKGGSIAIYYAQDYPAAKLVVAVPQMNLPYYMNKPFFKNNLFLVPEIHSIEQPEDLLRQYFAQNRSIDYFYTNSDELSNHSLIEFARDIPGLTKYRINGKHGDVARAALPSILNIIRNFIGLAVVKDIRAETLRTFCDESFVFAQARIETGISQTSLANWYLEGNLGETVFRALLTEHSYDFVKYSDRSQRIIPAYDPVESINKIVGLQADGAVYRGQFPMALERSAEHVNNVISEFQPILGDTDGAVKEYAIVNGATYSRFKYISRSIQPDGETVEVHFVDDIENIASIRPAAKQTYPTKNLIIVESIDEMTFANLFALRCVMTLKGQRLRIVVHSCGLDASDVKALVKTDWVHVQVVLVRAVTHLNMNHRPFSNWIRRRRLNILQSAQNEMRALETEKVRSTSGNILRLPPDPSTFKQAVPDAVTRSTSEPEKTVVAVDSPEPSATVAELLDKPEKPETGAAGEEGFVISRKNLIKKSGKKSKRK